MTPPDRRLGLRQEPVAPGSDSPPGAGRRAGSWPWPVVMALVMTTTFGMGLIVVVGWARVHYGSAAAGVALLPGRWCGSSRRSSPWDRSRRGPLGC
ncbi:MAG TPA: hypothetical protein VF590_25955 [Isosphaeraceae bacterium]|jgi:hypothetical protein